MPGRRHGLQEEKFCSVLPPKKTNPLLRGAELCSLGTDAGITERGKETKFGWHCLNSEMPPGPRTFHCTRRWLSFRFKSVRAGFSVVCRGQAGRIRRPLQVFTWLHTDPVTVLPIVSRQPAPCCTRKETPSGAEPTASLRLPLHRHLRHRGTIRKSVLPPVLRSGPCPHRPPLA